MDNEADVRFDRILTRLIAASMLLLSLLFAVGFGMTTFATFYDFVDSYNPLSLLVGAVQLAAFVGSLAGVVFAFSLFCWPD